MVGWFIEQQQIDFREENAGEHRSVLLSAAEGMNRPFPIRLFETDAAQHPLHFRVQRVAIGVLVVVLQLRVFLEDAVVIGAGGVGEIVLDRAHFLLDGQDFRKRRLHVIEQRHPLFGIEVLADVPDREARSANDLAAVGLFLFEQKFEERGLPRAVAADESDFLARIMLPRQAAQDVVRSVRLLDIFESIQHRLTVNLTSCAWQ